MNRILVVEDDTSFGVMLEKWLTKNGFEVVLCSQMEQARNCIKQHRFQIVITDLRLPDGDGIMLLAWIKEQKKNLPVIIMTSYAEVQSAVSAIKLGAFDFLEKPVNPSILKQKIDQALQSEPIIAPSVKKEVKPSSGMVLGKSPAMKEIYDMVRMVAPTRMSVLILGESGTGKEYIAHLIHEMSNRSSSPFIAVDCGSLSKELAASELFGHLKGSFTSAIADKTGVFEQADGGTVFLDEVGNLSYNVQIQLLRAFQEKKIRPVGAVKDIPVDVRIIVATNENLEHAMSEGRFREDLYHRLNEFAIVAPPLRERKEDIPVFAAHFLREANEELGKNIFSISPEVLKTFEKQYWGGNLRELRNVIRRAALFARGDEITMDHLPLFSTPFVRVSEQDMMLRSGNEREQIEAALKKANGNKTIAAKLLKIDRKTLYNKMHQYEMKLK